MASPVAFNLLAKAVAIGTPPLSGEATTKFLSFNFLILGTRQKLAYKLSQGVDTKPCSWSEWISTVQILFAPACSISLATTDEEIGTLGRSFLSCLAYPKYGMMAIISDADALLAASIIKISSIMLWSTWGGQVGWIIITLLLLMLTGIWILTSPSANLVTGS